MPSLYERCYEGTDTDGEHAVRVEGTLPPDLRGALVRNGPGSLRVGSDPVAWLDGHALVAQVTFGPEGVRARSRFVATALRQEELAAGRITERTVSTNLPSRWSNLFNLHLGDPANHDVYRWNGSLWASGGNGHYELDPGDLSTKGMTRWTEVAGKGDVLCAMPCADEVGGRLVAYVTRPGVLRHDHVAFFERDPRGEVVARAPDVALRAAGVPTHDLAYTPRWYLTAEICVRPSVGQVLWGSKAVWSCLEQDVPASNLLLVPRGRPGEPVRVPLSPTDAVVFHLANAYEEGDRVVVYGISYEKFPDFAKAAGPELRARTGVDWTDRVANPRVCRWVVDPARAEVVSTEVLGTGETPVIDPRFVARPSKVIYLNAPCSVGDEPAPAYFFYFHGVNRLEAGRGEVGRWSAGPGNLCGPPAFVPRGPDEGDGWVLVWVVDGATGLTDVAVLDGVDLDRGPVAWVRLGQRWPTTSHTHWLPALPTEST